MYKIFSMRDFLQGYLKVFGYRSDCSCCTAEKDGPEKTDGRGLTGAEALRYSLNFCLERGSKINSLNLGLLYLLSLGSSRHWETWNAEV